MRPERCSAMRRDNQLNIGLISVWLWSLCQPLILSCLDATKAGVHGKGIRCARRLLTFACSKKQAARKSLSPTARDSSVSVPSIEADADLQEKPPGPGWTLVVWQARSCFFLVSQAIVVQLDCNVLCSQVSLVKALSSYPNTNHCRRLVQKQLLSVVDTDSVVRVLVLFSLLRSLT